jgi:uncharacterized protein (DUF924 family)
MATPEREDAMAVGNDAAVQEVLDFWREAGGKRWFKKDPAFDAEIRARFEARRLAASRGELDGWADSAEGALALLLLLDQFPRNIYRGSPHAFATDRLALAVAERAVARGFDLQVPVELQVFFYLPFEHAEDAEAQRRGVELCQAHAARGGHESYPRYALIHQDLIARFGRFPHRNAMLGRISTPAELAFLAAQGGFKG